MCSLFLAVRVGAALTLFALAAGFTLRGGGRWGGGGGRRGGRGCWMATYWHGCVIHMWFIWHLGKAELKHILGHKKNKKNKSKNKKGGKGVKQQQLAKNCFLTVCCLHISVWLFEKQDWTAHLQLPCHAYNIMVRWVVLVAVGEHESDIASKLLSVPVFTTVHFPLMKSWERTILVLYISSSETT